MRALEGSLGRLQTDHVDVYFNHAVNDVARLRNPEWPAFVARGEAAGQDPLRGDVRPRGKLIECLDFAIDHKLVDVVLVAYNFGQDPAFYQRLLGSLRHDRDSARASARAPQGEGRRNRCRRHEGADGRPPERHAAVREAGGTFAQAAFAGCSRQDVDALIVSMTSRDRSTSTSALRAGRRRERSSRSCALRRGARRLACRFGCDACSPRARRGVDRGRAPDPHVRRGLRRRAHGARGVRAPAGRATPCLSCAARPCQGACSHGLPIERLLAPTHRLLTA